MPNKLTDADIKKALECCANLEACEKCSMASLQKYDSDTCEHQIMLYALDLINRQEGENEKNENIIRIADKTIATLNAENESLKAEIERLQETIKVLKVSVEQAHLVRKDGKSPLSLLTAEIKAEAYKEFVDKIKKWKYQSSDWSHGEHPFVIEESDIDEVLNELVGDENGKNV